MGCVGGGSPFLFLKRESFRMDSFIGFFDSYDVPVGASLPSLPSAQEAASESTRDTYPAGSVLDASFHVFLLAL